MIMKERLIQENKSRYGISTLGLVAIVTWFDVDDGHDVMQDFRERLTDDTPGSNHTTVRQIHIDSKFQTSSKTNNKLTKMEDRIRWKDGQLKGERARMR